MQMTTYTKENWAGLIEAMHSGKVIQVNEEVFYYFLEVLPPVYMGVRRIVGDGTDRRERRVSFGFAEGAEPITAFWSEATACDSNEPRSDTGRTYYCQRTPEMNRS